MAAPASILLVTADDALARDVWRAVTDHGHRVFHAKNRAELAARLATGSDELILAELSLDGVATGELVASASDSDTPVIVLVPPRQMADAVAAVRAGASDFLQTPIEPAELDYVVAKVLSTGDGALEEPPRSRLLLPMTRMIGSSPELTELSATIEKAADGVATVLVRGESGSGKELVARLVHELSPRRAGPFVKVHAAALPDNLLESELFGYERGAFTGATSRKPGRVELAEGGTLFLDEIGDITPAFQVKLLRLLQDREYERLGGTETLRADVRFVTATHQNLEELVSQGRFREDLFYRLAVVALWVPPLRARRGDIEPLALHFCTTVAQANGRGAVVLDVDALELLTQQDWPGNVRQLQNFIERLVVLASGPRLTAQDVTRELGRHAGPLGFAEASGLSPKVSLESSIMDLELARQKAERRAIRRALEKAGGNRNVAARLLGISRRSLYYKLQELGLS